MATPAGRVRGWRPSHPAVDALDEPGRTSPPVLSDYLSAASVYIRERDGIDAGGRKRAEIRLSAALGVLLLNELRARIPMLVGEAGERRVAGGLRVVQADVSEYHELDGLRLAIEIKPVNAAIGRAIWNRFGDIRTFAVNIHLKFRFAVVGGVLVIPTYEMAERVVQRANPRKGIERVTETQKISTRRLIERAVDRLRRAGSRRSEGDADHLLEAVAVIVFDPDTEDLSTELPPAGSGLRWEEFIDALVEAYRSRFVGIEDEAEAIDEQDDDQA